MIRNHHEMAHISELTLSMTLTYEVGRQACWDTQAIAVMYSRDTFCYSAVHMRAQEIEFSFHVMCVCVCVCVIWCVSSFSPRSFDQALLQSIAF